MEKVVQFKNVGQAALMDAFAITLALLIPAISHTVAFPLHAFEPMRIILFGVILARPGMKWNAVVLAALLPIVSFAVSGHPIFPKNLVMSGELVINVLLFYFIFEKIGKYSISALCSILMSKVLYYLIKYLLISQGLIQMSLFSSSIVYQLVLTLLFALAFVPYDLKDKER